MKRNNDLAAAKKRLAKEARAEKSAVRAFEEGQTARAAGLPRECPLKNPARVNHWLRGWDDAEEQQQRWQTQRELREPENEAEREEIAQKWAAISALIASFGP